MGMKLEQVSKKEGTVVVQATGSKMVLDEDGTLTCWQRFPEERKLLEVKFSVPLGALAIGQKDDFACTVAGRTASLTFQADSVVLLQVQQDCQASFTGFFKPAYHAEQQWLLCLFIDPKGGFGLYPLSDGRMRSTPPNLDRNPWTITYDLRKGHEFWLSIFPPRPLNQERAFWPVAIEQWNRYPVVPFPTNQEIDTVAKHCKIYVDGNWYKIREDTKQYPNMWVVSKYVPLDDKEFKRVRDRVKKDGMKFVIYATPYYFKGTADDCLKEMRRIVQEYGVDGFYVDGISMNFVESYRLIRAMRQIVGNDGILYVHCSADPLRSPKLYCPFIDTYADYILRGEAGTGGLDLETFLRWVVSGYHISNAVGEWCYYGSGARGKTYVDPGTKQNTGYVMAVPTSEHIDLALKNEVRHFRMTSKVWDLTGDDLKEFERDLARFDREYYRKLEALRKSRMR